MADGDQLERATVRPSALELEVEIWKNHAAYCR